MCSWGHCRRLEAVSPPRAAICFGCLISHISHTQPVSVFISVGLLFAASFRESDLEGKARAIQERLALILEDSIAN